MDKVKLDDYLHAATERPYSDDADRRSRVVWEAMTVQERNHAIWLYGSWTYRRNHPQPAQPLPPA